jgi:hypothetical protein
LFLESVGTVGGDGSFASFFSQFRFYTFPMETNNVTEGISMAYLNRRVRHYTAVVKLNPPLTKFGLGNSQVRDTGSSFYLTHIVGYFVPLF